MTWAGTIVLLTISNVFMTCAAAAEVKFKSSELRTPLLELYTSESCSSCPPADKWFSKLRKSKDLWRSFVPVVFHVDYWNHLNWVDGLSSREMSQRQRAIASTWSKPSVYTPGVVLDGKEWQGWRLSSSPSKAKPSQAGVLELSCTDFACAAQFVSVASTDKKYVLHLVLLGFEIESKVTSGENSGSLLTHDFSVLDWQQQEAKRSEKVSFKKLNPKKKAKDYAVVSWVESVGSPLPLQSVGGFLK